MSINHILENPELDIVVKSINVGGVNYSPFNDVITDISKAVCHFDQGGSPAQKFANSIRIHVKRNGNFIEATGYCGYNFEAGGIDQNSSLYVDIEISHPEVADAYIDPLSRGVATNISITGFQNMNLRTVPSIDNVIAVPVGGTNTTTIIRQNLYVSTFASTNNFMSTFTYSILCPTK